MPKVERDLLPQRFKGNEGLSLRQIARITELGYQTVKQSLTTATANVAY